MANRKNSWHPLLAEDEISPAKMETSSPTGLMATGNATLNITTLNQNITNKTNLMVSRKPPIRMMELPQFDIIGRSKELEKIHNLFQRVEKNTRPLSRMVIITGSSGMGKTETAKSFAHTYKSAYPSVVFLDSETEESLEASFHSVAEELQIEKTNPPNIVNIYKEFSSRDENVLFIFDNAVGLESSKFAQPYFGIKKYLPTMDYNKLPFFLVTSRNTTNWRKFLQIPVPGLYPLTLIATKEVEKHLLEIFKLDNNCENPDELKRNVNILASYINGHPMALTLLKEFCDSLSNTELSILMILRIFRAGETKSIHNEQIQGDHLKVLKCIFHAQVEVLNETNTGQMAVEILGILAYLEPNFIHLDTCWKIFTGLPMKSTQFKSLSSATYESSSGTLELEELARQFQDAASLLQKKNLITIFVNSKRIQIHHTKQELARKRLEELKDYRILEKLVKFYETRELPYFSNRLWMNVVEKDYSGPYFYLVRLYLAPKFLNLEMYYRLKDVLVHAKQKDSEEYRILKLSKSPHGADFLKQILLGCHKPTDSRITEVRPYLTHSNKSITDLWKIRFFSRLIRDSPLPKSLIEGPALSLLGTLIDLIKQQDGGRIKDNSTAEIILQTLTNISQRAVDDEDETTLKCVPSNEGVGMAASTAGFTLQTLRNISDCEEDIGNETNIYDRLVETALKCYPSNVYLAERYWRLIHDLCILRVSDLSRMERALMHIAFYFRRASKVLGNADISPYMKNAVCYLRDVISCLPIDVTKAFHPSREFLGSLQLFSEEFITVVSSHPQLKDEGSVVDIVGRLISIWSAVDSEDKIIGELEKQLAGASSLALDRMIELQIHMKQSNLSKYVTM